MTVLVTKIVKYERYKIILILSNINNTFTMSWTSVFTSQMTMISNFITINIFFTKLTNITLSIIFFILFCHNDIFISILKKESHFIF